MKWTTPWAQIMKDTSSVSFWNMMRYWQLDTSETLKPCTSHYNAEMYFNVSWAPLFECWSLDICETQHYGCGGITNAKPHTVLKLICTAGWLSVWTSQRGGRGETLIPETAVLNALHLQSRAVQTRCYHYGWKPLFPGETSVFLLVNDDVPEQGNNPPTVHAILSMPLYSSFPFLPMQRRDVTLCCAL